MRAYYNEFEPYPAQWLRDLSEAGHIAPGVVDDRSIKDVQAGHVRDFTQAHFFAGIGGWSLALRLAGWPDGAPVWTGSCPCQPFSVAGRGKGTADERHLWPVWRKLIAECLPPVVFGEQVASPSGRDWLADLRTEMEALGYEVGAADLCAAGVGAPHIRQRSFWGARRLAHGNSARLEGRPSEQDNDGQGRPAAQRSSGESGRLANADSQRREGLGVLLRPESSGRDAGEVPEAPRGGEDRGMGHGASDDGHEPWLRIEGAGPAREARGPSSGSWADCEWITCRDGKTRPVEPGICPVAHGVPGRVGSLRGYGNAVVPQAAAAFIRAFAEA